MTRMETNDESAVELFLVDCGIDDLTNVHLDLPRLEVLNLHSNYIARIVNIGQLANLRVLDLSSNQLTSMDGLEHLQRLEHLNLSCNLITALGGISRLTSLLTLNLSYNNVSDISGLAALRCSTCKLYAVELQGNRLSNINHIFDSIRHCQTLKFLVLEDTAADNPVCHNRGYAREITRRFANIVSTRKQDVPEQLTAAAGVHSDDSSQSAMELATKSVEVFTPNIDFVLQRYKSVATAATSEQESSSTPVDSLTPTGAAGEGSREHALQTKLDQLERELLTGRIDRLEQQLATMATMPSAPKEAAHCESDTTETDLSGNNPHGGQRSKQPVPKLVTSAAHKAPQKSSGEAASVNGKTRTNPAKNMRALQNTAADAAADKAQREAVHVTYSQFLSDLTKERERRWKAEEAAKKLAEEIAHLRTTCAELEQKDRSYEEALHGLRKTIEEERQLKRTLEEAVDKLTNDHRAAQRQAKEAVAFSEDQRRMRRLAEESLAKLDKQNHELVLRHGDEKRALEKTVASYQEDIETLKRSSAVLKKDLDDLRSLFAIREREHRSEIEARYSIDSPKLEEIMQAKVASLIKRHGQELQELERRLDSQQSEYCSLEDEFRLALQVEAERFNTLQDAYERVSADDGQHKRLLVAASTKQDQLNKIVSEMTALIKEQKEKIVKLSTARQEQAAAAKETQTKLETQLANLRKQVFDMDRMKKEVCDLKAQVQGQHSIIVGLRTERELWSKELAQQGASLSADRGKLEAKIETLTSENGSLRSQLQQEVDTVKIKVKVIQDQTESIAALKQKLAERERALQSAEKELEIKSTESKAALAIEKEHTSEVEEANDQLTLQVEELRRNLSDVQAELDDCKEAHRVFKNKWKDKSAAIAELETQVQQTKQTWEDSNRRLAEERDKAVLAADLALKKLRAADDAFRLQLERATASHAEALHEQERKFMLQIAEAEAQVEQVENEMRELLADNALSKQQTEAKMKQAAEAFALLQKDLLH